MTTPSKPVEVWCVVDGERILAYDINAESFRNNDEMTNYRCERRLLVKEGETFVDGVDAAFMQIHSAINAAEQGQDVGVALAALDLITALSPQPKQDVHTQSNTFCPHGVPHRYGCPECDERPSDAATFCPHGTPHRYPCEKCDVQPSDAERLADMERQNRDQLAEIILLEKEIAALRAKGRT